MAHLMGKEALQAREGLRRTQDGKAWELTLVHGLIRCVGGEGF